MSEALLEKVDHVQLPVNDIDQAVKWYTNTLGFEPLNQMPHCAWVKLNEGPVLMFHLAPASSIVRWLTNDAFPMPAFMFLTKNINLLKERLEAVNATIRFFQDEGFGWVIKFTDPFGNELGAYQPNH